MEEESNGKYILLPIIYYKRALRVYFISFSFVSLEKWRQAVKPCPCLEGTLLRASRGGNFFFGLRTYITKDRKVRQDQREVPEGSAINNKTK